MKKMIVSAAAFAVVAFSAVAMAPTSALANSAFARQTGQACSSCHFQAIPRLNANGRDFRINAFRGTGTPGLIEDEGLSLPAQFNAGLNMALALSNGKWKDNSVTYAGGGVFELPDLGPNTHSDTGVAWPTEAELVVGGRYGDNFGGVATIGLMKNQGYGIAETPFGIAGVTQSNNVGLTHYKLAFVYDTEMGPVAIAGGSTENRGAPYLFNDPSNVFGNNLAGWGHQSLALSQEPATLWGFGLSAPVAGFPTAIGLQLVSTGMGVMSGATTGLGLYTHLNGMVYLAVGGLIPASVNDGLAVNFKVSPYVRAAFTGNVVGFDLVAGGWYYANKLGDWNATAIGVANETTKQYGLDLQVQGNLPGGGATVGFYLPWQLKGENLALADTTGGDMDTTGLYPMLTVGITAPVNVGVRLGYDYAKTKTKGTLTPTGLVMKDKAWVVGAWLGVAQNVLVDLEYVNHSQDTDVPGSPTSTLEESTLTATVKYVY